MEVSRARVWQCLALAAALWVVIAIVHAHPAQTTDRTERGTNKSPCVPVYRNGVEKCLVRPRWLAIGAKGVINKIRWRSWGNGPAVGIGRLFVAGFIGDPDSGIGPTRGRVRFRRVDQCGERLLYTRVKITYGKRFRKTYVPDGRYGRPCPFRARSPSGLAFAAAARRPLEGVS